MTKILSTKPLRQVILEQNAELQHWKNPQSGKSFFQCGNVKGYISSKAAERLAEEGCQVGDFNIGMVEGNDGASIPCLILAKHEPYRLLWTFTYSEAVAFRSPIADDDDLPF